MQLLNGDPELEALNKELDDPSKLEEYKRPYDNYHVSLVPKLLGKFLIAAGNLVYGKNPSYLKFRSIEVIARVPYHSWASVAYTLITVFYTNEKRAQRLSRIGKYARLSQDNETMHVVVISQLVKTCGEEVGFLRHTLIPMFFAFFYFWVSYLLYMIRPRYSLELNYLFEQHAFEHYDLFINQCKDELSNKTVESEFLEWYGRSPRNQYEFFRSLRNDELIHRNRSIREIPASQSELDK